MHGGNAPNAQPALQAQIEIGSVDADEHRRGIRQQPLAKLPPDAEQFRQMVRQANGLALEVMADGLFLAGDEAFRQEIEQLRIPGSGWASSARPRGGASLSQA